MIEAGNLYAGAEAEPGTEQFDRLLDAAGVRIMRIVSREFSSPPGEWFEQAEDEWVVLLRGGAVLEFDPPLPPRTLAPGDYLRIPAGCRHRIAAAGVDGPALWLAVHLPVIGDERAADG